MAYKNDSVQTIMGRYGKASDAVQTEMYETWDAIRHMAVSGNALGGSGLGAFNSFLMNIARMFGFLGHNTTRPSAAEQASSLADNPASDSHNFPKPPASHHWAERPL
jgi:hypothetical protein